MTHDPAVTAAADKAVTAYLAATLEPETVTLSALESLSLIYRVPVTDDATYAYATVNGREFRALLGEARSW